MDQITHKVRREHWLNVINACQARGEGITVKQWLKDNGISHKSYYYWLRRFRKEAYERMKQDSTAGSTPFVELPLSSEPDHSPDGMFESGFKADAIIKLDGCVIALSNTASENLCRYIMEGLGNAR